MSTTNRTLYSPKISCWIHQKSNRSLMRCTFLMVQNFLKIHTSSHMPGCDEKCILRPSRLFSASETFSRSASARRQGGVSKKLPRLNFARIWKILESSRTKAWQNHSSTDTLNLKAAWQKYLCQYINRIPFNLTLPAAPKRTDRKLLPPNGKAAMIQGNHYPWGHTFGWHKMIITLCRIVYKAYTAA